MSTKSTMAERLRGLLKGPDMVVAPGAYDAITARLIERAGFPAVYMTGAGVAAAQGFPDYGLVTMSEMAAAVEAMARSISIPLIADADTGYGNELNVVRSVAEYESKGAAAIQIEDQVFPKRCGHLDDKELIPADTFARKIRAADYARKSDGMIVIARTDARAMSGMEEAIRRGNMAFEAGADVIFIEAPQSVDEIRAIPRLIKGPCLFNMVRGGKTPLIGVAEVEAAGYKLTIVPGLNLVTAMGACEQALQGLRDLGRIPDPPLEMSVVDVFRRVGLDEWDEHRRVVS